MHARIYDLVGIGIGPFNLGLACLADPIGDLDCLFLERNAEFSWHGGTLLEEATLQTPFLCDLVTLADPTSRFSLVNYMKETGRIYSFYAFLLDTENFFLPRNEFNRYYRWAAEQLGNLRFGMDVEAVEYDPSSKLYHVRCSNGTTGQPASYLARRLVLGSGMIPAIPEFCEPVRDRIVHTAEYLANRDQIRKKKSITVVGSGQSAAEVYHDLLNDIDRFGYSLNWVTRSPRLVPRELTKQTLQMTSPEYTDYFFSLPRSKREALVDSLKTVYQGINPSLINGIFDLRYRKMLKGDVDATLQANTELSHCSYDAAAGSFRLGFYQAEAERSFESDSEALILGTGYRWKLPAYLEPIKDRISWSTGGRFAVARNCSIDKSGREIFVPNAEIHADSFIPPDLGQACYRNSTILREVTGRDIYRIEKKVAFQRFAAPEEQESEPVAIRA